MTSTKPLLKYHVDQRVLDWVETLSDRMAIPKQAVVVMAIRQLHEAQPGGKVALNREARAVVAQAKQAARTKVDPRKFFAGQFDYGRQDWRYWGWVDYPGEGEGWWPVTWGKDCVIVPSLGAYRPDTRITPPIRNGVMVDDRVWPSVTEQVQWRMELPDDFFDHGSAAFRKLDRNRQVVPLTEEDWYEDEEDGDNEP